MAGDDPGSDVPVMPRTFQWRPAILTAAFALGGCASAPPEDLIQAHATMALAVQARLGAAGLARAEAKLALGGRLMNAHAYGTARWAVEQSQVDAELALARSAAEDAIDRAAMSGSSRAAARPMTDSAF